MRAYQSVLLKLIAPTVLGAGMFLWYTLEVVAFPVISDFVVTKLDAKGPDVKISGLMKKVRDCEFMEMNVYAVPEEGPKILLDFDFEPRRIMARSIGVQTWGPWELKFGLVVPTRYLELSARHRCHALWTQVSPLALIDLSQPVSRKQYPQQYAE